MTELIWDCMTPVLQISRLCCYLVFMPFFAVECSLCVCVCVCVCVCCAGVDILITYFTPQVLDWIKEY